METKKVAKEYLQKDILRTIYQMRKWKEDDKQIKRILVLDYDLTEYYWKSNIKKLQEEGFLETDSDAKIPALTESGTEYARQLQRAAEGWNQFLQMSRVDEKTADRDGRLMACEVSDPDKIDNLWKFINDGGRSSIPKSVDCHTLWKKLKPGKYQMWYSFYTTEIEKERKAAIEDMRFERDGWLHIEPWEIWLELTEHPENEDDRTIWYQNMHGIWKKAEVNDHSIKIPATAFHIEYEQQWLGEIHFTCNLGVSQRKRKAPRKKRYAYWMEGFCRKYRISCSGQIYKKDRWER